MHWGGGGGWKRSWDSQIWPCVYTVLLRFIVACFGHLWLKSSLDAMRWQGILGDEWMSWGAKTTSHTPTLESSHAIDHVDGVSFARFSTAQCTALSPACQVFVPWRSDVYKMMINDYKVIKVINGNYHSWYPVQIRLSSACSVLGVCNDLQFHCNPQRGIKANSMHLLFILIQYILCVCYMLTWH